MGEKMQPLEQNEKERLERLYLLPIRPCRKASRFCRKDSLNVRKGSLKVLKGCLNSRKACRRSRKKHLSKFLPTRPNTLTTVHTMLTNVQNALRSKKKALQTNSRPTAELLPTNFYSEEIRTCRELLKKLPTRPIFSRIFASSSELPDLLRQSSDYQNSEEIRKKFIYVKPGL